MRFLRSSDSLLPSTVRLAQLLLFGMVISSVIQGQEVAQPTKAGLPTEWRFSLSPYNIVDNFSGTNLDLGVEMRKGQFAVFASGAVFMPTMRFEANSGYRLRGQLRFSGNGKSQQRYQQYADGRLFVALDAFYKAQEYTVVAPVISTLECDYRQRVDITRDVWGSSLIVGATREKTRLYVEYWFGIGFRHRRVENNGLRNPTDQLDYCRGCDTRRGDAAETGFIQSVAVGYRIGLKPKPNA